MEIIEIEHFLSYYSRIKNRKKKLFEYIPPDKIEWTYQKGKFTIGDIIPYLANIERHMFAENVQLNDSTYKGCGREYADGCHEIISFYNQMQEESYEIFLRLRKKDLLKKCKTPGAIEIAVWKWLRAMMEHEIHHRGQLYIYIEMLGIKTPPLYGLTSEEVIENSVFEK